MAPFTPGSLALAPAVEVGAGPMLDLATALQLDYASLLPLVPAGELSAATPDAVPAAVAQQAAGLGPVLPPSARGRHSFSLVCACNMNRCVAATPRRRG